MINEQYGDIFKKWPCYNLKYEFLVYIGFTLMYIELYFIWVTDNFFYRHTQTTLSR